MGALADGRLAVRAEDGIPDAEALDPRSDLVDGPAHVAAEDEREAVLHEVLVHAGRHRDVGRIDRGRLDPDPDLALTGRGIGELVDGSGRSEHVDGEGAHGEGPRG